MELKGFLQVLYNRRWLLLTLVSVSVITTYLIAIQAAPVYKSRVRLIAGITQGENALFTLGTERGPERYEVEARFRHLEEMIRSPKVISLVSYALLSHDLTESIAFRDLSELRRTFSIEEQRVALRNFMAKRDSLEMLQAGDELDRRHLEMIRVMGYDVPSLQLLIDVRRIPGTDYIAIEAEAENPELAAFLVNQLSREFVRYYLLTNAEISENTLQTIGQLVRERKEVLDEKLKAWTNYQQQQNLVSSPEGLQILTQIEELELAREAASRDVMDAEKKIIQANQGLPLTRGNGISLTDPSGEEALLKGRILRLNDRYVRSGLRQVDLQDSLRAVKRLLVDALLVRQQSRVEESGEGIEEWLRQKLEGEVELFIAQSRLTSVAQELRRLASRAGTYTDAELSTTTYGREVEVARDAYLTALQKLNDVRLGMAPSGPALGAVSQMELAQPAQQPEPSQAFLLAALAGLISLGISFSLLLFLEYLDESIKLPSKFTPMTGLPLLGSLIKLKSSNLDLVALFHDKQKNPQLEIYKNQLRDLRHEIMLADPVTLMVTSTRPGSGKSSLVVSLAYSLSLSEKKVLLVDTNLGNASLTAMTGASPTLQPFLKGTLPLDALISPSVFDHVDVIGCEKSKFSPSEAFPHEKFEQLLVNLSDNYDHILLEGAALNEFVDAKELLLYSARILPVFAADAPIEESDKRSIAYLKTYPEKLMAGVLNKVEPRHLSQ